MARSKTRNWILTIISAGWLVCYMDRIIMSLSIPSIAKELSMNTAEMGIVLSAFSLGYAIMQIPGGMLADKFGPRALMVIGLIWWSVFTGVTALVSSFVLLIVVRILFGLGEGLYPGAYFKMLGNWFPSKERGSANGIGQASQAAGMVIGSLCGAAIIAALGWRWLYGIMFIPGLIVALLVRFYTSEKPSLSKHISAEEIAFIEENAENSEQAKSMTFGELLKHPTVWQLTLGFFCYSIASTGFISWLPTYLISGRGFTTLNMGFAMALILLASVVGLSIGGFITDKFFKNNRKVPFFIFMALGAGFFYLTIIGVSSSVAVTFMTIAVFLLAIACAAYWTIPLTVLPKEVFGAASATVNLGGMVAGFFTPMIIGFIVQASGNNYNYIFFTLITACILSIIAIVPIRSGSILQSVK